MANAFDDKSFASNYMLLKPEELGFFDLIHVLFAHNLEKKPFVDSPEGPLELSFRHRWLIFISILTLKFLLFVATPLAYFGSLVEFWLNLVSSNQNVFMLIFNIFRGKAVIPSKASACFSSLIGNLDNRVELDKSIKRQDINKYNAVLSVMASKVSYENVAYIETTVKDHWKMEYLGFYDFWNDYQRKASTQAFILADRSEDQYTYVVAFRGTEPFNSDDWCSDFDISWYELPGLGKMHGGFMKALGLQRNKGWPKEITIDKSHPPAYYAIRDILKEHLLANKNAKFILTGHSLGGALAILFAAILMYHDETILLERLEGVYTFGQPRVGDEKFAANMVQKLRHNRIPYYRFVYCNDIVPRLPYDDKDLMFKHFGQCIYCDRNYQLEIVKEEPNENYFSPKAMIPMMSNAFREIIRSFTIARKNGPEYRETFLLRLIRMVGLFIPGIPAHCPQDYVNAARLGVLLPQLTAEDNHKHD
ncbi:hypothetical protein L6164_019909 [Bauhinia variegata]|uniref:Uncharacterized protein n=1 Tax=Bauhinia variegata TaxID=167791 RepID=A0ACB9MTM1_BAUVA|nr:hypothetical protein L6164_019909 [Bauhinia variegata]